MVEIYLDHPAVTLGPIQRTVEEAEAAGDLLSPAAALREAGFAQHCICPPDYDVYQLARDALRSSQIETGTVDCIIYATCLPLNGNLGNRQRFEQSRDVKDIMVFPASCIQAEFGMDNAFVIGLNQQGCTGMLGSVRLARSLLLAEQDVENVLCITADRFPPGALYEQAYNLISDGAAVCRVSKDAGGFRILACHQITNGGLVNASDDQTLGSYFNYVYRIVTETLARSDLDMDDIKWIVPQNTNIKAWHVLSGLLGVTPEKAFFNTITECGHVISADNILNLQSLVDSGQLNNGDRILTFMAGFGSHWQCLILERV